MLKMGDFELFAFKRDIFKQLWKNAFLKENQTYN